ncbi:MAG TPA: isoprenylcysteine carboxylmethyltransferase family protein [Bacteroidales bacterium]|nr:isoprenylcysteine carboxylmethyltransferase family protein [Bacteroidales bacterium]
MNRNYIIKHLAGSIFFIAVLFICAGRLDYWQGLVYVAIGFIMSVLHYTLLKPDKELLEERSKPGENTKKWDTIILGLSFVFTISMYVVAGLDSGRYHLSPDFSVSLYFAGFFLTVAGQLLFLTAQKQNKFFSSTVRIQKERNHAVCDTGLYKLVRHPAYLGSIIQATGFPLLLGSVWSILPASALVILFVARTILEDKTLQNELEGYRQYSARVRYRLIPFVW